MTNPGKWLSGWILVAVFLTGCDQIPGMGGGVAVIDLGAVAKASGQEAAIQQQAEAQRANLNAQLQEAAASLDSQLTAEREKIGDAPNEEQTQQLQQMAGKAQRQYAVAQQQAQAQAQQFETNLVMSFREKVKPIVEQVSLARGAKVVMLTDVTMLWFVPSVDVTDEVIAKLRADPSIFAEEPAEPTEPAASPEPAASSEPAVSPEPAPAPAE